MSSEDAQGRLQRQKDAFLQRFQERKQRGGIHPAPPTTTSTPLLSNGDKDKEQAIVEMELTNAAAGPPGSQRAVTQDELDHGLAEQHDAHAAFLRAATYKKECEELVAELGILRALCAEKEKMSSQLKVENDALNMRANEMCERYTSLEKDLFRIKDEQLGNSEVMNALRQEKQNLEGDRDALTYRSGVLEQNLKIQDQNIKTLKTMAVGLSTEVETYKARIDVLGREHRLAELKLQEELAKETSALRNDFEAKMGQLRKLLDESEDMRQRAAAEWRERELRLERKMHEELRTKDGEVIELRKRMEELMRQQITNMKDRLEEGGSSGGPVTPGGMRFRGAAPSMRDMKKETDDAFRDLHFGQRIISLLVTSTCEEGNAVTWTPGKGARHNFDPRGRMFKVRLHADPSELTLSDRGTLDISGDVTMTAEEGSQRKMKWNFFTKAGARLNVTLEIVPA